MDRVRCTSGAPDGFAVLLSRRVRAVLSRFFGLRWLSPLAPLWGRISGAFDAYRFQYRALALAFGLGLLGIVCTAFVNWLLSESMGGLMPLPTIFLLNPLIALVLMLPISIGGIGVSQAAYPFFLRLGGRPASHALAVSLLMQAIVIIGSLPGAVFWLMGRRRRQSRRELSTRNGHLRRGGAAVVRARRQRSRFRSRAPRAGAGPTNRVG